MGKIKKSKLSWNSSESTLNLDDLYVGYRLYWSNVAQVSYNSNFIELGNITEVDLTDFFAAHELSGGLIYFGVSAVDRWGNESDITSLSEPYKLSPPAAPVDITLTILDDYNITVPVENPENQDTDIQKQATEKTDQKKEPNETIEKIADVFGVSFRQKLGW